MAMEIANFIALKNDAPFMFKSAGITPVGGGSDENVELVLSEIGIKSIQHTPVPVSRLDVGEFDAIHVMNSRQKVTLCSYFNNIELANQIMVLNIEDHFSKGLNAYRECRNQLMNFYERFAIR